MKRLLLLACLTLLILPAQAQTPSYDQMNFYTQEWEGERFADGRPKVSDSILERMENVSIEEAWGVLRGKGYHNQFADANWKIINPNRPMVGRALTVQYMPNHPDYAERMEAKGKADGRIGAMNSWPIDMLVDGDIYIADSFGKIVDGTLIGDNLGNSIFAKSGKGVVFNGSARDLEGLEDIEGFNAWVRDWDPSFLRETMVTGINVPDPHRKCNRLPWGCHPREEGRRDYHSFAFSGRGRHQRRVHHAA